MDKLTTGSREGLVFLRCSGSVNLAANAPEGHRMFFCTLGKGGVRLEYAFSPLEILHTGPLSESVCIGLVHVTAERLDGVISSTFHVFNQDEQDGSNSTGSGRTQNTACLRFQTSWPS